MVEYAGIGWKRLEYSEIGMIKKYILVLIEFVSKLALLDLRITEL